MSLKIATKPYSYPKVRAWAAPTAHPLGESWPGRSFEEPAIRFARLQKRLAGVESTGARARSVVVLPSRSIEKWHEPPAETQAYEERLLCSLLQLREPDVRMTYVTSSPVAPAIVDYYLSLIPRRIRRAARSRLTLVAVGDHTRRPLSEKVLGRPDVLARIRGSIPNRAACHLAPYTTTSFEQDVALALDIPMYGAAPCHAHFGTKSGCRQLFAAAGVPHPVGFEGITSFDGAISAILKLRAAKPSIKRLVMKLNDGVAGEGNAIIDLSDVPPPGGPDEAARIVERVTGLVPEAKAVTGKAFLSKFSRQGGIIEEWISAAELRSPSVQLQLTPAGEVRVLSTHDQILGGPTRQSYLGCRFPAAPSYGPMISSMARGVGESLVDRGVVGRLAIDFVLARNDNDWQPFAIELNLRKGGTTHPYDTLVALTGGAYDPDTATFSTPTGAQKHYVATDHLEAPQLRHLGRDGVLALTRQGDMGFDRMRRAGVVFHMLSSLDELGRAGFTAVADSAAEADALYENVQATLLSEAQVGARGTSRAAAVPRLPQDSYGAVATDRAG